MRAEIASLPRRTIGANGVGRVLVDIEVANNDDVTRARLGQIRPEQVRRVRLKAIADSGATKVVLPKSVVKTLGLQLTDRKSKVTYADGRTAVRPIVAGAQVEVLGRSDVFSAIVEPNRETALLGAIVMEDLDLLIDCTKNKLIPRDPNMMTFEIE